MKALVAALAAVLLVVPAADAAKRPATVKCHWIKATKKHKRHKVCVKVKAKTKTTKKTPSPAPTPSTSAPATTPAPVTTPAAPAPAAPPAATAPVITTPAPTDAAPTALTRLQTTAREWSLTLSRPTIAAGALSLQLVNVGEDAHDLHVRPAAGGADLLSASTTASGTTTTISGSLPAGTYTLYCSLPGHEAAGMHATLTVTP
jgi:plastocyanin